MPDTRSPADLLRSADEETRQAAFDRILAEMDDDLAREIVAIATSDGPEEVRADAIIALGPAIEEAHLAHDDEFPEPDSDLQPLSREIFHWVVDRMRKIYDDPSEPSLVRRRAFEVLVRSPQPWQETEIREQLRSSERGWRLTAVFAMGWVPGFANELVGVLETAEGDLLFEAVHAAGAQGVEAAADRIRQLATSDVTDRDIRLAAIEELPWVDPDSFELLDDLSRSDDAEIAAAAEEALDDLHMRKDAGDSGFDEEDDEEEEV